MVRTDEEQLFRGGDFFPAIEAMLFNVPYDGRRGEEIDESTIVHAPADVGGADVDLGYNKQSFAQRLKRRGQRRPIDCTAGPLHHPESDFLEQGVWLVPGRQLREQIGTDEPVYLLKSLLLQRASGVNGIAWTGATDFQIGNFEGSMAGDSGLRHGQTISSIGKCDVIWLVGWLIAGNKQNAIEVSIFGGGTRADEMSIMDWIETSAEAECF